MSSTLELKKAKEDSLPSRNANCRGRICQLGTCPSCLIIWGIVAVFLLGKALLEMAR